MEAVRADSTNAQQLQIECQRLHKQTIKEVLEFNSSVAPCPSCLKAKQPPHFFSRPTCLSLLARHLEAKIYCKRCQKEVDVLDVVPPQVFLSYNWGHDNSTQKMVRQVKQKIEDTTSLQCWLDVEGGINPGEDHMQRMEHGVSRCELFVMFVSDKYVKSANCRREYRRACETGKYIIPVFVPVLFAKEKDSDKKESESGWTGDTAKDWWKSIAGVAGPGADEDVQVDWNRLASFSDPLELKATRHKDGSVEVSDLNQLVAAVQARVYRGSFVFHGETQEGNSFLGMLHRQRELIDSMLARIDKLQTMLRKNEDSLEG
mmetsp:Transcript_2337/g.5484  ORF Transcript_2337/g.5484 Transcript_2337/m.5484 type:complete len:317 (-) Transcript_2337:322-1272(-)